MFPQSGYTNSQTSETKQTTDLFIPFHSVPLKACRTPQNEGLSCKEEGEAGSSRMFRTGVENTICFPRSRSDQENMRCRNKQPAKSIKCSAILPHNIPGKKVSQFSEPLQTNTHTQAGLPNGDYGANVYSVKKGTHDNPSHKFGSTSLCLPQQPAQPNAG